MEAEGIADRDDQLTDAEAVGFRELSRREPPPRDADDRKVGGRIGTDDGRADGFGLVCERYRNLTRAFDDMCVREGIPVRRHDDATPAAAAAPDVHHARRDPLDDTD